MPPVNALSATASDEQPPASRLMPAICGNGTTVDDDDGQLSAEDDEESTSVQYPLDGVSARDEMSNGSG
jgi:hypothetical protein